MTDSDDHPLNIPSPEQAQQMRHMLQSNGFASPRALEGIKLLGGEQLLSGKGRIANSSMSTLADSGFPQPLETLLRMFVFGATVGRDLATQAVSPMKLEDWIRTGLVIADDHSARAALQLLVYRNLAFTLDFESGEKTKNHVIGITPATQTLEMLTIRRQSRSTLDIGAGTGIQAMIAAAHSDRIVATDINARAVNVAAFNARLNGLDIDCRVGDLFEPVGHETFDLIISCPPFVISPDDRFHYLDSGRPGDQFLEKVVTEGVQLLNEGGYLQIMCQVVEYREHKWSERIASWLDDSDCDAWMLYNNTVPAKEHARMWIAERSAASETLLNEWVQYYNDEGITCITSGLLTIRKNSARKNWFSVDPIPRGNGYCGHSIESGFTAMDFLNDTTDNEALLDARLALSQATAISQPAGAGFAESTEDEFLLELTSGFIYSETVDAVTMTFLRNCSGEKTVREAMSATEKSSGQIIDEQAHLTNVRMLVGKGFLTPL